ncbi:MAG: ribosome maturation factor RimM [Firmicutes bacterium]|nr:ribosome maturation factor RimM [Bacillota bacterium]
MELIKIAVVVNTQGLKGTLKVKSFTDFKPERYQKGSQLHILFKGEYIPVTVSSFREQKGLDYLTFAEFDDINQVEKYRGCDIFFDKELASDLDEDEFYFTELIGLDVFVGDLKIGVCEDVREYPQGEIIVVSRENQSDLLIPFIKEFIEEVDKENRKIVVIEWDGLL